MSMTTECLILALIVCATVITATYILVKLALSD